MPQVLLVVDTFDAPYGLIKQKDKTDHAKPIHLPANFANVQSAGTVLLTLDIDPSTISPQVATLATNFILPAQAAIAVDGTITNLSTPGNIDVKPGAVITASLNGGCVAIRLLKAESVDGIAHH